MGLSRFWTPEKPGCGCKLVVDFLFSKQFARVRFPPPALILYGCFLFFQGENPHLWMAKFSSLGGGILIFGWQNSHLWMAKFSSLGGEILIFGWRNSHFWVAKFSFLDGTRKTPIFQRKTRPNTSKIFFRACIIYIYIYIYLTYS